MNASLPTKISIIFHGCLISIDEGIIYSDIYKDRDALYTMLLTTGYLTLADEPSMRGIFLSAKLRIPNKEIRSVYAKEIIARIEAMEDSPRLLELLAR